MTDMTLVLTVEKAAGRQEGWKEEGPAAKAIVRWNSGTGWSPRSIYFVDNFKPVHELLPHLVDDTKTKIKDTKIPGRGIHASLGLFIKG